MDLIKYYKDFVDQLKFYCKAQIPEGLSFFFFKNFCKKSQAEKVLWHLEMYGSITNLQCHAIYGIRHAPSVIRDLRHKLRAQGNKYKIQNRTVKGCNRFGEPCYWDEYVLVPTEDEELKLSA